MFLVLCTSCCTRPTYLPFPVIMALAHILRLLIHNYIMTLLLTCVSSAPLPWCRASVSWTDGCAAISLNWTPTRWTSSFSGMRKQIEKANFHFVQLGGIDVNLSTTVTRRLILIDSELMISVHIKRLTRWCFNQFCQLHTVRRTLSVEAAQSLVYPFVISHVN